MAEKVASLYVELSARTATLEKALDNVKDRMEKTGQGGTKLSATLKEVLGGAGLTLSIAGLTAGFIAIGKGVVQAGMAAEQTEMAFTTLLGSTAAAQQHLTELRDFAAKTPFEFTQLTDASRKLQAFGFAAKDVVPMLTDIGDAVSAMGGNAQAIDRVTLAIGQMSAKGKLQAGEMLQLTEAGIPAWRYLAESMGMTTAEVMKLSEKGLIPAQQGIDAILAGMRQDFGGMMAEQATTAAGKMSNLEDAITRVNTAFGVMTTGPVGDVVSGLANTANYVAELTEALQRGDITWQEYTRRLNMTEVALAAGGAQLKEIPNSLREQQRRLDAAMESAMAYNEGMSEAARTSALLGEAQAKLTNQYSASDYAAYGAARAATAVAVAEREAKQAADELRLSQETLSAAIAGPIGQENEKYIGQQAELRLKAKKLKDELKELETAHGRQFMVTRNSAMSANELQLAQLKLADAQKKLADETDPLKQASLAVEVDKLTAKIQGASVTTSGYVDNSKRIGEIKGELDNINAAFEANAAAHEEATARIVFGFLEQRVAADGLQEGEIAMLAEVGKAWGIYDQKTADALAAVDAAISEHGTNARAIIEDVGRAIDGLPESKVIDIQVRTNNVSFGAEPGGAAPVVVAPGQDTQVGNMRQHGGPVTGGMSYMVGEAGPELFEPWTHGRIVPNNALHMGGVTININGVQDPRAVAAQVKKALDDMGRSADGRMRTQ